MTTEPGTMLNLAVSWTVDKPRPSLPLLLGEVIDCSASEVCISEAQRGTQTVTSFGSVLLCLIAKH